jgi:hypothetical protein
VGKRPSKDGKRDDSETPTSVVLCNLRIVPEYFCSSGDVNPSVVAVDILMCLMFEKRTAHGIVQRSWWEHSPSFSRRRRPTGRRRHGNSNGASTSTNTNGGVFGATSTTEDVLSGVNLRGKQILVPVFRRDWAWRGRAHSPHMAHMLSARHGISRKPKRQLRRCCCCADLSRRTL